jgi:hypothetical protein
MPTTDFAVMAGNSMFIAPGPLIPRHAPLGPNGPLKCARTARSCCLLLPVGSTQRQSNYTRGKVYADIVPVQSECI